MTPCQRLAIEARFLSYVKRLPNGCMIWLGGQSRGGAGTEKRARGGPYGSFYVSKEIGTKRAHIVWAWLTGKLPEPRVPDGFHLDHDCASGTLCVCCTELTEIETHRKKPVATRHADTEARVVALDTAREARLTRMKAGTFGSRTGLWAGFG